TTGTFSGKQYFKPKVIEAIFTSEGVFNTTVTVKNTTDHGLRRVACVQQGEQTFYVKLYPEAPDREAAVYQFAQQVFGSGVPYGELFVFTDNQKKQHPLWISQGVSGYNLQAVINALSNDPKVQKESTLSPEEITTLQ